MPILFSTTRRAALLQILLNRPAMIDTWASKMLERQCYEMPVTRLQSRTVTSHKPASAPRQWQSVRAMTSGSPVIDRNAPECRRPECRLSNFFGFVPCHARTRRGAPVRDEKERPVSSNG
jgi:hypothetical protein